MQESHKKRKPSKKEMQQKVVDTFEKRLKEMHIKGMIQGSEIFSQLILDNIANGKTLDDIKSLCETNLHSKETMEKVVMKEKENE